MMKIRHKKIVASGTAVALAGILGCGSPASVQRFCTGIPGYDARYRADCK